MIDIISSQTRTGTRISILHILSTTLPLLFCRHTVIPRVNLGSHLCTDVANEAAILHRPSLTTPPTRLVERKTRLDPDCIHPGDPSTGGSVMSSTSLDRPQGRVTYPARYFDVRRNAKQTIRSQLGLHGVHLKLVCT